MNWKQRESSLWGNPMDLMVHCAREAAIRSMRSKAVEVTGG